MSRIDHIGIATENIDLASRFWEQIGLKSDDSVEHNLEQGVKIKMFYGALSWDLPVDKQNTLERFF